MPITFYNIRTKEKRTAVTAPHIAAFYNSSDQNPNAQKGQDMGWRLGPETFVELKKIKQNQQLMERISQKYNIPYEDITDYNLLTHISAEEARKQHMAEEDKDFTEDYEKEIRELENGSGKSEEDEVESESQKRRKAEHEKAQKAKAEKEAADKKAAEENAAGEAEELAKMEAADKAEKEAAAKKKAAEQAAKK